MDNDEEMVLRRWMQSRAVIDPNTFETVIRAKGKTIAIDTLTVGSNTQLWDIMKEELWELCQ